jgi:hypothetical protein
MDETTRSRIRHIFRSPRPNFALMTAADLLGFTLKELKREIEDGAIVAVWTALGERMTREELVAVAMQTWEQSVIEAALGKDAPSVLPRERRLCAAFPVFWIASESRDRMPMTTTPALVDHRVSATEASTTDDALRVLRALSNPKWDFRTIGGIARETKLSHEQVEHVLADHQDLVRQSHYP